MEGARLHSFGKSRYRGSCEDQIITLDDGDDSNGDSQIIRFSCGDGHSVVVTKGGQLHTFGSNDWGQLGNKTTTSTTTPSLVKVGKNIKIVDAFCGRNHTIVLSSEGKLYSFGAGADNAVGHGDCQDVLSPKHIAGEIDNHRITKVACGAYHTMALTSEGDVWVWGSGSESQLGNYEDECAVPTLLTMEPQFKVVDIAAGYYHSAIVSEEGKLYVFGEGEAGKLGQGHTETCEKPTRVKGIKGKVLSVSCGGNHTCVATDLGHVYTFGAGQFGQLGVSTKVASQTKARVLEGLGNTKILKVRCGGEFTALMTDQGEIYTFGDGHHGKLGHGPGDANVLAPQKVSKLCNVLDACCGGSHLMVLARDLDKSDASCAAGISPESRVLALPPPGPSTDLPPLKSGGTRLRPLEQTAISDDEVVRKRSSNDSRNLGSKKSDDREDSKEEVFAVDDNARAKAKNANTTLEDDSEDDDETGESGSEEEVFAESDSRSKAQAPPHKRPAPRPTTAKGRGKPFEESEESGSESESETESESSVEASEKGGKKVPPKSTGAMKSNLHKGKRIQVEESEESSQQEDDEEEESQTESEEKPRRKGKLAVNPKRGKNAPPSDTSDSDDEADMKRPAKKRGKLRKNQVEPDSSSESELEDVKQKGKGKGKGKGESNEESDDDDIEVGCCGKKKKKKTAAKKVHGMKAALKDQARKGKKTSDESDDDTERREKASRSTKGGKSKAPAKAKNNGKNLKGTKATRKTESSGSGSSTSSESISEESPPPKKKPGKKKAFA